MIVESSNNPKNKEILWFFVFRRSESAILNYIIEAKTQSIEHNLGYVTKILQAENGKKFKQCR